ncbi:MAG: hydroxyacid dehydrogenase [Patescibacteria group bacterium]
MRILISEPDGYSQKALEIYKSLGEVLADKKLERQELLDLVQDADILVIRLRHKIDGEVLGRAKKLKIIACPTTGLDHIDLEMAKERGIAVVSLKGEIEFLNSITATAELAWGLLLGLVRKIPSAFNSVKAERWDRDSFKGRELRGKTLGIIGCGRLGKIIVQYGNAFLMDVLAYDPHIDHEEIEKAGAEAVTLEDLLKRSDAISIHVPLNSETENLIGEKEFNLMKLGVYIVNTSRGKVIDESVLLSALQNGKIGGAALDVVTNEDANGKFLGDHPLLEYAKNSDNLLIVPHIGGATYDSMAKTEDFIAEKVKAKL